MIKTKFIDLLATIKEGEELRIINVDNEYKILKNGICVNIYNVSYLLEENQESCAFGSDLIIYDLLKELGIPANLLGYRYIAKAIELCLEDKDGNMKYITKGLYPTIANYYETTPANVERNIRHAITLFLAKGNVKLKKQIFGDIIVSKHHLTNSEFIYGIVAYLRVKSLS